MCKTQIYIKNIKKQRAFTPQLGSLSPPPPMGCAKISLVARRLPVYLPTKCSAVHIPRNQYMCDTREYLGDFDFKQSLNANPKQSLNSNPFILIRSSRELYFCILCFRIKNYVHWMCNISKASSLSIVLVKNIALLAFDIYYMKKIIHTRSI